MSQRSLVELQLLNHGGLSTVQARLLGIGQLRTRITELRQAGWRIDTVRDEYAGWVYRLVQAPGEPPRVPTLDL